MTHAVKFNNFYSSTSLRARNTLSLFLFPFVLATAPRNSFYVLLPRQRKRRKRRWWWRWWWQGGRSCKRRGYPSNYAIRSIPARSRGSIAGRGKVRCRFSSASSFCIRLFHAAPSTSGSSSDPLVTCLFCNYYVLASGMPTYIIAD